MSLAIYVPRSRRLQEFPEICEGILLQATERGKFVISSHIRAESHSPVVACNGSD